jgi:NTE family protein
MRAVDQGLLALDLLKGLDPIQKAAFAQRLKTLSVRRGESLVRQGEVADALYIVNSGRFMVSVTGRRGPIAEIGPGQPIGEIGFLTGGIRTATVTALRDSIVLRLDRSDFDELAQDVPAIWKSLASTLAERVANTTSASAVPPDPKPRTIALITAGSGPSVPGFAERLTGELSKRGKTILIDETGLNKRLGPSTPTASPEATRLLNSLEMEYEYVVYRTDDHLSEWTQKALRHADLVLSVAAHATDSTLNDVERRASELVPADARRLVLLHPTRGRISGTRRWLEGRQVFMHHHVALDTEADIERLCRFISGTARGLVACGGGALCPTHVGVYRALKEAGYDFDIMGGTSAGSAIVAAFMLQTDPDEIIRSIEDMFVEHKAMRRYTLPRYSLLDHTNFDEQLRRYFGGIDIEDLWLPYFAVSTNLSRNTLHPHRRGDLWTAVRASASIPVLLPPIYTKDGEMLVDGGLLDNVPVQLMHELKSGPNVVISFLVPEMERFDVDYQSLPSRSQLLLHLLAPLRRGSLPQAPSLVTVLMRALMANRQDFQRHLGSEDLLLVPPISKNIGFLDWHRHQELYQSAYVWAKAQLARL